ncbi:MAG: gluconate 2-dehydrogenase subunit 3 family protein [Chloroflexota bacterium]
MASHPRDPAAQATERAPAIARHPIAVYPGWNVLSQQDHWDEATRRVVLKRVRDVPRIRFFDAREVRTLTALADRVLPQSDRAPGERIPIIPWIDQRCFERIGDGWRFEDMPNDEEAWRMGLRGIDETSLARHQQTFDNLAEEDQDSVLRAIAEGHPPGETWRFLPARRFWIFIVLRQICGVYFAHPTSWDEIGFGGPAYPRGYFALNHGYPEPWEVREVRLDATSG